MNEFEDVQVRDEEKILLENALEADRKAIYISDAYEAQRQLNFERRMNLLLLTIGVLTAFFGSTLTAFVLYKILYETFGEAAKLIGALIAGVLGLTVALLSSAFGKKAKDEKVKRARESEKEFYERIDDDVRAILKNAK